MTALNPVEQQALIEALSDDAGPLEAHIAAGGTFDSYVTGWQQARNAAGQATEIGPELGRRILALPMGDRWEPGSNVRDYLGALLAAFWDGSADAKTGMTGNSDWQYDLYEALLRAGLIPGWVDGYGIATPEDQLRADQLILAAINALASTPFATPPGY